MGLNTCQKKNDVMRSIGWVGRNLILLITSLLLGNIYFFGLMNEVIPNADATPAPNITAKS